MREKLAGVMLEVGKKDDGAAARWALYSGKLTEVLTALNAGAADVAMDARLVRKAIGLLAIMGPVAEPGDFQDTKSRPGFVVARRRRGTPFLVLSIRLMDAMTSEMDRVEVLANGAGHFLCFVCEVSHPVAGGHDSWVCPECIASISAAHGRSAGEA